MRYARRDYHDMERTEGTREKVQLNVANSTTGKALSLPCKTSAAWDPSQMLVRKSCEHKELAGELCLHNCRSKTFSGLWGCDRIVLMTIVLQWRDAELTGWVRMAERKGWALYKAGAWILPLDKWWVNSELKGKEQRTDEHRDASMVICYILPDEEGAYTHTQRHTHTCTQTRVKQSLGIWKKSQSQTLVPIWALVTLLEGQHSWTRTV